MLFRPMDILAQFPVRYTKEQKQAFRDAVQAYLEDQDYLVRIEEGSFGAKNLVAGDPETAKYVVTAHYDTCAVLPIPNLVTPFNPMLNVLYQFGMALVMLLVPLAVSSLLSLAFLFAGALFFPAGDGVVLGAWSIVIWILCFWILAIVSYLLMYFGPGNKSNANDNTSGVVTLLEIARTMPENQRQKVCFVLFDLQEKGMWGSRSYRKAHREATDHQLILNLDSVGDGDHIRMIPSRQLKKDRKRLTSLYKACGYMGSKSILLHEKGNAVCTSDQKHFPWGVVVCALRKNKFCYYVSRIHTKQDTVLDETNVNILRAALTSFICCDAVN